MGGERQDLRMCDVRMCDVLQLAEQCGCQMKTPL
jgi:hypothetical protein